MRFIGRIEPNGNRVSTEPLLVYQQDDGVVFVNTPDDAYACLDDLAEAIDELHHLELIP